MAVAEREHDETVVACADRVRMLEREVHETVTGADLERLFFLAVPLHGHACPRDDEEDLLLGAFEMERRRPMTGIDRDPLNSGGDRMRPGQ